MVVVVVVVVVGEDGGETVWIEEGKSKEEGKVEEGFGIGVVVMEGLN